MTQRHEPTRQDGDPRSRASDARRVAATLRRIVLATQGLPDDSPADALLRERLELTAEVLDLSTKRGADPGL